MQKRKVVFHSQVIMAWKWHWKTFATTADFGKGIYTTVPLLQVLQLISQTWIQASKGSVQLQNNLSVVVIRVISISVSVIDLPSVVVRTGY